VAGSTACVRWIGGVCAYCDAHQNETTHQHADSNPHNTQTTHQHADSTTHCHQNTHKHTNNDEKPYQNTERNTDKTPLANGNPHGHANVERDADSDAKS
jgi:hypothetical protein